MPNDVERSIGMWRQFRTWMAAIPLTDPLRREQAATLQSLIFLLILVSKKVSRNLAFSSVF
jgi:hypothetical protein